MSKMKKVITKASIGILIIILGILIFRKPSLYGYPVHKSYGIVLIIFGAIRFFYILFNRKKLIDKMKENDIYICPVCLNTSYMKDVPELKCSVCKVSLETLDGFYERHPEKK